MRYFYDTEFIDDGRTIDLISIGVVCEDGTYYYAVSSEFDRAKLLASPWLVENVWPHLPLVGEDLDLTHPFVQDRATIAADVLEFLTCGGCDTPELWAYYAAYDHVALAQLWGPMNQMPAGLPYYTKDLQQEYERLVHEWGSMDKPPTDAGEHNALADARWNAKLASYLGIIPPTRSSNATSQAGDIPDIRHTPS